MAEPKPFTDEELEKIRQFCDDGLCPQCENDHRFLATITDQAATIERLRGSMEKAEKRLDQYVRSGISNLEDAEHTVINTYGILSKAR